MLNSYELQIYNLLAKERDRAFTLKQIKSDLDLPNWGHLIEACLRLCRVGLVTVQLKHFQAEYKFKQEYSPPKTTGENERQPISIAHLYKRRRRPATERNLKLILEFFDSQETKTSWSTREIQTLVFGDRKSLMATRNYLQRLLYFLNYDKNTRKYSLK